ncbi:Alpha/beta hydrolase fold-1 [Macrophomina phaseolina MS6]|uniref:Alpha/beta hydrolase fold-1 n=1 Tax=Macrophomina phaseolina (strain MS6) TaxID=1126212 RepID=K2S7M7_MACPH|nr:Alpha/beta hydrolase fold-1 [Macrophomina phaseolina MS6]
MEHFTKKSFATSRSLTYIYYDSFPHKPLPTDATTPVLYLLHGFPDTARLFHAVLPYLSPLASRILIPDQLGHGATARPPSPSSYNSRALAADHAELLAHAGVAGNVVAIGHDWGAFSAQRLWFFHPALLRGVAFLNVAPTPPVRQPFDLDAANAAAEEATGHARGAYWELFVADDGAAVVDAHLDAFWRAMHGEGAHWMRDVFCVRGALRQFLEQEGEVQLREYARPGRGWREEWLHGVRSGGGIGGALCWYRAMTEGHTYAVEKELPEESVQITVPTLFLGCERDDVSLPAAIDGCRKTGMLPDLTVVNINAMHWSLMEKPEEVGRALYEWVKDKF